MKTNQFYWNLGKSFTKMSKFQTNQNICVFKGSFFTTTLINIIFLQDDQAFKKYEYVIQIMIIVVYAKENTNYSQRSQANSPLSLGDYH